MFFSDSNEHFFNPFEASSSTAFNLLNKESAIRPHAIFKIEKKITPASEETGVRALRESPKGALTIISL